MTPWPVMSADELMDRSTHPPVALAQKNQAHAEVGFVVKSALSAGFMPGKAVGISR